MDLLSLLLLLETVLMQELKLLEILLFLLLQVFDFTHYLEHFSVELAASVSQDISLSGFLVDFPHYDVSIKVVLVYIQVAFELVVNLLNFFVVILKVIFSHSHPELF